MPAADLTRLRIQIAELAPYFGQPEIFQHKLAALLDMYSDRAYRPGQAVGAAPLLPTYHVPVLVIRQLKLEFARQSALELQASLNLADLLWLDPWLETRQLAASLLGYIPASPPALVLERLDAWIRTEQPKEVISSLLAEGPNWLIHHQPDAWLELLRAWLSSPLAALQTYGVQGVLALVQDREFENLPAAFSMLDPILRSNPSKINTDTQTVMVELARRTPVETAYYLRQMLTALPSPALLRIARRCLPYLPASSQASLRQLLQRAPDSNRG
jgi:hypothetical protein